MMASLARRDPRARGIVSRSRESTHYAHADGTVGGGLVLGAAILASCASDGGDGDSAANTSIPDAATTAPTSTEAATVAPDIIPADESQIDEAYVQGVLDELYRVSGEAIADAVDNGTVTDRSIELLDAVDGVRAAVDQINNLTAAEDEDFARYLSEPSYVRAGVIDLLSVDSSCIIAEIEIDASGVLADPPSRDGVRSFVVLSPADAEERASGLNPTAWVVSDSAVTFEGEEGGLACG